MKRGDRTPLEVRFWAKVDRSGGPTACWTWIGCKNPLGYGQIGAGGKRGKHLWAHRVSYELAKGPIPAGLLVLHLCDNPPCVNPAHLCVGDQKENMAQMCERGRYTPRVLPSGDSHPLRRNPGLAARGELNGTARLTDEAVREIRRSSDSQRALARRFGVSRRAIVFVKHGTTWKHVACDSRVHIAGGKVEVQ